MAENNTPEQNVDTKPTVEEQLALMQKQMNDLASENAKIKAENTKNLQTISTFETTLAEELDKIKVPAPKVEVQEEKPKEVDTDSLLQKVLNKRKEQDAEFAKQNEISELEKIKAENLELKFKSGVSDLIDKDPYLSDFIKEGIEEKRFKSIEDVKMGLTPSVRKALQYTYNKSKEWEKAGKDPMAMYTGIEEATNQEVKEQKRQENLKNWAKILG
jgi:hypothetical protein